MSRRHRCRTRWAVGGCTPQQGRPRRHDRRTRSDPGRARRHDPLARFQSRQRPDRAHDARPARRGLHRRGSEHGRPRHDQAGRPDVSGVLRRWLHALRPTRAGGDDRGDPSLRQREGGRGLRSLLRLARAALHRRDAVVHRHEHQLTARPDQAVAGRARDPEDGRVRQARQEGRLVLRRSTTPADLQLPVDVRRVGPVRGARDLRRHHVHGLGAGCVRARGRHAPDGGRSRRSGRAGRRHDPLLVAGVAHRAPLERFDPWCPARDGRRFRTRRGRRGRVQSRSPGRVPRTAGRCRGPEEGPHRQVLARRASSGWPASTGYRPPTRHTTTSTSARTGTVRSRR